MVPDCLSAEGERRCRQLLARATARYRARPAGAAVLVALCLVRGAPALLYTLRSSRLAGRHKGDVSFPGGKCDPDDQDVVHTALRETLEELGLAVPEHHVWGILHPVFDQITQLKIASNPFAKGFRDSDPDSWLVSPRPLLSVPAQSRSSLSSCPLKGPTEQEKGPARRHLNASLGSSPG
ncbi:nucleoside diphosphate-linked moiety X motif 8-like [Orycteropus afer afer]|uniref:Nucleoside diphosphate-linked moiety X motif 8-like n=1 Tax=Orycteropus afer afer TaxID=1230840 RepID=A0A8B7A6U8_ORYAF|nr:nucleoside diphosphate-linked moiety X motif 8-like [Orycteropus afer afer]